MAPATVGRQGCQTRLRQDDQPRDRTRDPKKDKLKPHLKRQWCIGKLHAEFLARIEDILHLYSLPYDAARPVVNYDERPCALHGELVAALEL